MFVLLFVPGVVLAMIAKPWANAYPAAETKVTPAGAGGKVTSVNAADPFASMNRCGGAVRASTTVFDRPSSAQVWKSVDGETVALVAPSTTVESVGLGKQATSV